MARKVDVHGLGEDFFPFPIIIDGEKTSFVRQSAGVQSDPDPLLLENRNMRKLQSELRRLQDRNESFGGKVSDRQMIERFLILEEGDAVIADKRFTIRDLLEKRAAL